MIVIQGWAKTLTEQLAVQFLFLLLVKRLSLGSVAILRGNGEMKMVDVVGKTSV